MKIQLKNEMETLIIPLYGKAKMSAMGIFQDSYAEAAITKLNYDYSSLKIQNKTQVMLAMRAAIIDGFTKNFIGADPNCMVLHLGCGLDARYFRLGLNIEKWYDLDFPQVIDIKRQLYHETENYKYIASSVTNPEWVEGIEASEAKMLVIAEGLLMYLSESEIKALFRSLALKFQHYTIIFDAYSKLTAKSSKYHPSLKKTGAMVKWGIDDPREIEGYAANVKHLQTLYLTDKNVMEMMPKKYRTMFMLAGLFKSAREAHRVFIMNVGD